MHLFDDAITELFAAEALITTRQKDRVPVDAAELDVYTRNVLGQFHRGQPRIATQLQELAQHVTAWFGRLRGQRSPTANSETLTVGIPAAASDRCRVRRQHCWPVVDGAVGRNVCRCRGRMPAASAWNGRLPWRGVRRASTT